MSAITIVRTNNSLGRQAPSEDAYSAICFTGVAVSGGAQLNTVYELNSAPDAEDLGIDAAYDTSNKVLVYYHVSEFFRITEALGVKAKLFIMIVAQTTSLTVMATKSTTNGLAKLLRDVKCAGKVRQAGLVRNPADGYTPTTTGGIDNDVIAESGGTYTGAVVKAQELAEEERSLHRPVFMLVEGRSFNGTASGAIDLKGALCNKVSVTILQDKDVADADTKFQNHAAVGTVLGLIATFKVNECIGWVQKGNIQSGAAERFLTPALSSNTALAAYSETDRDVLDGKGYVMPKVYQGYTGVFVNNSPTCTAVTDDYANIENNRVMDKAERKTYLRLLPNVNRPLLVDQASGKLAISTCKYFEGEAESELASMVQNEECSGVDAYVNPDQNVLATSLLEVNIEVVPTGKAETIKAVLGFKNPFNK